MASYDDPLITDYHMTMIGYGFTSLLLIGAVPGTKQQPPLISLLGVHALPVVNAELFCKRWVYNYPMNRTVEYMDVDCLLTLHTASVLPTFVWSHCHAV